MSLVTIDEALAQLGIPSPSPATLAEVADYVDAIGGRIEQYLGEILELRSIVEDQIVTGTVRLSSTPVVSLTSIATVDGSRTWDVSQIYVSPTGKLVVTAGLAITGLVRFTYQAGYADIPLRYKRGALVILQHVWESQRGVSGVQSGVMGPEELHPRTASTFTFPNKAMEWLGPRPPVVA